MVIYSDKLIHVDIDPKTDILKIKWPNLEDEPMAIVHPEMSKILRSLELFQVSKLLIDTKDTKTNINEEEFKKLSKEFVKVIASSNLKKLARIVYAEPQREIRARMITYELQHQLGSSFESREFANEETALAWLESDET